MDPKAIFHVQGDLGGMVEIDKETCIGCGACVNACPFEVPELDPEDDNNSEKCSFCAHRVVEGESTYCAEACPVEAIHFGDREELVARGEERVEFLKTERGRDKAKIYGLEDTGVLLLLDEDADVYELPEEGFTTSSVGWRALNAYGGLAVAAVLGGYGYNLVKKRMDDVKAEREEKGKARRSE